MVELTKEQRASDVTAACVANKMYSMGIAEELPPSLSEYSLEDLIHANHAVRDGNGKKQMDGTERHQVFCDDRLIAALYVAYHYEPEDQEDCEPIIRLKDRALVYLVLEES